MSFKNICCIIRFFLEFDQYQLRVTNRGKTVEEATGEAFRQENLSGDIWLGVQSLASDGLLIKIDAIAVITH